jgi:transcriptional regulator with XRE-family HTH domain
MAREAAGLSQQDVADAAGVKQSTIGNIEAGIRKRPRELLRIAGALGVRAAWLQTGEEPMKGADTPPPMSMEWPFELLTREQWNALSERQRGAVEAAAVAALRDLGLVPPVRATR